ncbi:hypothetical protein Tco_1367601 [Tanacetum coccineum]
MSSYSIPYGSTSNSSCSTCSKISYDQEMQQLHGVAETVSKVPGPEDTIKFMLNTQEFIYTLDMFRDILHLPVETLDNPFVAPVNFETIEDFMNRFGYQGVVNKVSAFYTKNLAQPWQKMFKVFNRCLTTRTSRHDLIKINILQLFHAVINRTNVDYAALLWWDFMNNVKQKKEAIQIHEDYHSIKDDVPLVSVYTTRDVRIRGMLILNEFLTEEIHTTNDFKESTPKAHRTPTLTSSPQGKKRKQSARESNMMRVEAYDTIVLIDTVDEGGEYTTGGCALHRMCRRQGYIQNIEQKCVTTKQFWKTHKQVNEVLHLDHDAFRSKLPDLVSQEFNAQAPKIIKELFKNYVQSNMKRSLQDQANDPALWEVLKQDDSPPEGEKRVKRHKASKSSKSARGSSSKHSTKDSTTYVSKLQQQQEWDAWVEETVIDKDEEILGDETPELIIELQDVDKRVLTIFDYERMKATLNDALSNQFKNAKEYAYHLEQTMNFMENQII